MTKLTVLRNIDKYVKRKDSGQINWMMEGTTVRLLITKA